MRHGVRSSASREDIEDLRIRIYDLRIMEDIDHRKVALLVAEQLKDCGFDAFACLTSTAFNYGWGEDAESVSIKVHVVCGGESDAMNLRQLRDEVQMDDFACFENTEEVFTGVCGHPETVESLAEQMEREPWLRRDLELEEEEEEE